MLQARVAMAAAFSLALTGSAVAESRLAEVNATSDAVAVRPLVDGGQALFTLTGPGGFRFERTLAAFEPLNVALVDAEGIPLGDGDYAYEVRILTSGKTPDKGAPGREGPALVQSGRFRVVDGVVVEPERRRVEAPARLDAPAPTLSRDQVFTENLIGRSACFSSDAGCVNGEALGIIDVKMKGNIPLIRWERTGAGDKSWDIDVDLGGFRIAQVTDGRAPLLIADAAPTNSVRVDGFGRVGLGTSTPGENLHVVDSSDSSLRLQVGGQAWDLFTGSGSTALRVFNATGGGIPLVIATGGDVGVGPSLPSASLHVRRSNGTAQVFVEEASGTVAARRLLDLQNRGDVRLRLRNTASGVSWGTNNLNGNFVINKGGSGLDEFLIDGAGNVFVKGVLVHGSDRNAKDGIEPVVPDEVLDRVAALPISTWHFKDDRSGVRHLGPMAQDFAAAFGLGADDRHIAPTDVAGVALAAIQALQKEKEREIAALRAENSELADRVKALESAVAALTGAPLGAAR
jgi:Chaperone of endosialidase